jgi:class 3 adenylate cyclase
LTTPNPSADACCDEGERHLKNGAPLLAYDVLSDALQRHPTHVRLRQLLALSMARSGATRDANAILMQLVSEGQADEETLGLLARTDKDVALDAIDPDVRRSHLARAFAGYTEAYKRTAGYWSGINAATMAILLGRQHEAESIAADVQRRCLALSEEPQRPDRYWLLATLGETALIRQAFGEAEDWYGKAAADAAGRHGDLVSTRRNARLILKCLGVDPSRFDATFNVPRVVVFAGHLIDRPDRYPPRFPPALEPAARDAIDARVVALRPGFGYASAGSGGDILFLESLARIGAASHVVLPYNREQFRVDCVDIVPGSRWSERYDQVLAHAAEVVLASDHPIGGGMSYEYGFRLLDGAARVKADDLDSDLVCLALWDGRAGDGRGGTASAVEHWQRAGRKIEVIDLAALAAQVGGRSEGEPTSQLEPVNQVANDRQFDTEIVGLLFADAKGFSRLTEAEIPLFVEHFLGTVADAIRRAPSAPLQVNTWGDGLYLVFDSVAATGMFALELIDAVRAIDWRARGFTHDISLRIGLHAGPAYVCIDPVTERRNYLGAHVSRAAHIEPIAPPGEVYASGACAALARTDQVDRFRCTYVGQTPLAKGYGTFPTYVVRRAR